MGRAGRSAVIWASPGPSFPSHDATWQPPPPLRSGSILRGWPWWPGWAFLQKHQRGTSKGVGSRAEKTQNAWPGQRAAGQTDGRRRCMWFLRAGLHLSHVDKRLPAGIEPGEPTGEQRGEEAACLEIIAWVCIVLGKTWSLGLW